MVNELLLSSRNNTHLSGEIRKVVVAGCGRAAASDGYRPTGVGLQYDADKLGTATVTMQTMYIHKLDKNMCVSV
jgi:hypothetical protein